MIISRGKYYLYRHLREDKEEPFLIGIGTKRDKFYPTYKCEYERAFCRHGRPKHWHNIVNLTKYKVEILLESNDYEFIKQKEIEFIKLYGRTNSGTGILTNLTDGGDGMLGIKKRIYLNIYQYDIKGKYMGTFPSITDAHEQTKVPVPHIRECVLNEKGNRKKAGGYYWKSYKSDYIIPHKKVISEETKEKMRKSAFWTGKSLPQEIRDKVSITRLNKPKEELSYNLGRKHTPEAIQKMKNSAKSRVNKKQVEKYITYIKTVEQEMFNNIGISKERQGGI